MTRGPARAPAKPPEWDPSVERYWDERDLEGELKRTFHICQDCRMCVTYCGSFPLLFEAGDREIEAGRGGVERLSTETIKAVADHCWQCKLCYIKCPYTADEGAYELLDFPRLMAREKAQRARREGIPIVDRVLGEPALIGTLGAGAPAKLANLVNANRLMRKVTEKVTGISAEFPLPPMASTTFSRWFRRHTRDSAKQAAAPEPQPSTEMSPSAVSNATRASALSREQSVLLFPTCYGEYNFPEVPEALVRVLEHNGFSVILPEGLACCGMPNLDGGDVEAAKRKMQRNVDALLERVRAGTPVIVPGPTCGYTIKKEWPMYLGSDEAKEVAERTFDAMEFFERLRREKKLKLEFKTSLGRVLYHAPCHLRAQKIGFPGARVLGLAPDTDVRVIEQCSAVDGTWGMKAAYYDEGVRYAKKLTHAITEEAADEPSLTVVSDCSLAGLRVLKETGKRPLHPVELLAKAYGLGGTAP